VPSNAIRGYLLQMGLFWNGLLIGDLLELAEVALAYQEIH
jgi:hypothetical protein